jgi:hypothetical protein
MSHKHNSSKIAFRPFPTAAPTQDADTLRRRAYHLAGHALMANNLQLPSFYFFIVGRSVDSTVRAGEIDGIEICEGKPIWSSLPDGGLAAAPEWTEMMSAEIADMPADEQCFVLAAGCAAETLLDPAYAKLAIKQATGDRARFHRLLPIPNAWDDAVLEVAKCLATDRPALDKIATVVEKSLQTIHRWKPIPNDASDSFGLKPGTQFCEAALFSKQVQGLVSAARHESFDSFYADPLKFTPFG